MNSAEENKVLGITEAKSSEALALKVSYDINYVLTRSLELSLAYSFSHICKIHIITLKLLLFNDDRLT